MAKTWTAVSVTVSEPLADAVGSFLIDHGAPGLESEDRGGLVRVTAHFSGEPPLAALRTFCDALAAEAVISVDVVADQAWAESWKDHFPPLAIGSRLFIHPPWVTDIPAGRLGIAIDPGMAFGTGHHPSTRGGLVLLERHLEAKPNGRVLDVGIGSGILAIAAAKLGARGVVGVDVDPEACAIAAENAIANGVAHLEVRQSIDDVREQFDVVVANLLANLLVGLIDPLRARLAPGGVLIGSGMLVAEATEVSEAWRRAGLIDPETHVEDGWATLACTNPASPR